MKDPENKLPSMEIDPEITKKNPLWKFSIYVYEKQNLQKIFLDLQDEFGLDVIIIIFCLWLSLIKESSRQYKTILQKAVSVSEIWQRDIIMPIRTCRQNLKGTIKDSDLEDSKKLLASVLRDKIKCNELSLEAFEVLVLYNEVLRIFNKKSHEIAFINLNVIDAEKYIFHYIRINGTNLSERLRNKINELIAIISGSGFLKNQGPL